MNALVTGANGLIGANLVRALLADGHRTRGLVRSSSDLRSLQGVDVELARGDIFDINTLIDAAEGCDVLFHVAALFSYSKYTPDVLMKTAQTGTLNVIEAAKEAGIDRIVLTSSSVVIGSTMDRTILDEEKTAPETNPTAYVASKSVQEHVGFERAKALGIDMIAVCPTICLGSHDYGLSESNAVIINYLNDPFKSTWPGGCNIVSVRDVADGHIRVAEKGKPGHRYLLGSENMEWSSIHRAISEMCGVGGPFMTAGHTSIYLAATFHEITSVFTKRKPLVTREQAKMVGRYYWYDHHRAVALGYHPMPARQALAEAVSWLVTSPHVSGALRSSMKLSREIYEVRAAESRKTAKRS